jgi:hypothetical protein
MADDPMTERQGKEIIKLLEKILSELGDIALDASGARHDLKAVNDNLYEISSNTRKVGHDDY